VSQEIVIDLVIDLGKSSTHNPIMRVELLGLGYGYAGNESFEECHSASQT